MSKKANRILRILLVEDMPSVRNWEKMLLEQHNQYDVLEAENGQQAMEMIEKYHKQNQMIDLVLSDWRMPEMDGVQLYAEMKKYSYSKNIPFIMVSAESDPQLILKILETGIDHYITKPFSEKELQERIDMALKKSHCSIIHR